MICSIIIVSKIKCTSNSPKNYNVNNSTIIVLYITIITLNIIYYPLSN